MSQERVLDVIRHARNFHVADMDVDTVLREALRLDECLSELYQEVIDRAQTDRIKEVFTNLLEVNKKEMRDLVRDSGHLRDW